MALKDNWAFFNSADFVVGSFKDDSGNSRDLTYISTPPTLINTGGKPDGYWNKVTGSPFTISNSATINYTSLPFGFNMWIRPDSTNLGINQMFLFSKDASNLREWDIRFLATGVLQFTIFGHNTSSIFLRCTIPAANFTAGNWYHIVGNYYGGTTANAANLELYLNNTLFPVTYSTSGSFVAMPFNNTVSYYYLRSSSTSSSYFTGDADNGGIRNQIITSAEVNQLYNSGKGLNPFAKNNSIILQGYGYSY